MKGPREVGKSEVTKSESLATGRARTIGVRVLSAGSSRAARDRFRPAADLPDFVTFDSMTFYSVFVFPRSTPTANSPCAQA